MIFLRKRFLFFKNYSLKDNVTAQSSSLGSLISLSLFSTIRVNFPQGLNYFLHTSQELLIHFKVPALARLKITHHVIMILKNQVVHCFQCGNYYRTADIVRLVSLKHKRKSKLPSKGIDSQAKWPMKMKAKNITRKSLKCLFVHKLAVHCKIVHDVKRLS